MLLGPRDTRNAVLIVIVLAVLAGSPRAIDAWHCPVFA